MKDYPVWIVTSEDLTPEEIQEWGLLARVGFWYVDLDSALGTYLQLQNRGRRTRIPGIARDYLTVYPIKKDP